MYASLLGFCSSHGLLGYDAKLCCSKILSFWRTLLSNEIQSRNNCGHEENNKC
jgi:hypothetical protein